MSLLQNDLDIRDGRNLGKKMRIKVLSPKEKIIIHTAPSKIWFP